MRRRICIGTCLVAEDMTSSLTHRNQLVEDCGVFLAFDDDDEEEEDDDFHRILGKQSRSSTKKSTMKRKERTGSSSLSDSNDSEVEGEQQDQGKSFTARHGNLMTFSSESRWSKNKENLMRDNVDLASLRKRKPSKKKQRTASLPVQRECWRSQENIDNVENTHPV